MNHINRIQVILLLFVTIIMGCKKTTSPDPTPQNSVVSSTSPANNTISVARNNSIAITFNEAMNPATINGSTFTLMQGNTSIPGSIVYSDSTAVFTPTNSLLAMTKYTATVSTGVESKTNVPLVSIIQWSFTTAGSSSGQATVNLGTAINYVILAKTEISNISTTSITGNIGLSPAATSYITGFSLTNATGYATSSQITGDVYAADMATPTPINLTTSVNDMVTAYNDAAGRTLPDFVELNTGNIGGKILTAGLYKWTNTVTAPSNVTISGGPNDIWIFQIAGNLTVSSAVNITLSGGAQASNIFWQVAGEVTIGTTAQFQGIVLSKTGITLNSGATLNGRTLAQTAVILDQNTITQP
jgi:hypothetical protein